MFNSFVWQFRIVIGKKKDKAHMFNLISSLGFNNGRCFLVTVIKNKLKACTYLEQYIETTYISILFHTSLIVSNELDSTKQMAHEYKHHRNGKNIKGKQ